MDDDAVGDDRGGQRQAWIARQGDRRAGTCFGSTWAPDGQLIELVTGVEERRVARVRDVALGRRAGNA